MQNIFLIAGLLEETRGKEKEEENDRVKIIEICHICLEMRHNEMHQKLLNNTGRGKMIMKNNIGH
jgi:hypothetical protein